MGMWDWWPLASTSANPAAGTRADQSGGQPGGVFGGLARDVKNLAGVASGGLSRFMAGFIGFLDKIFGKMLGDNHFFGKLCAGLPGLTLEQRAKMSGKTVAQEQTKQAMKDFDKFDPKNQKSMTELDKLAKKLGYSSAGDMARQQGFNNPEEAHLAAKLGFRNSAEFHFVANNPKVIQAGGVGNFVVANIRAGVANDAHGLAAKMGYIQPVPGQTAVVYTTANAGANAASANGGSQQAAAQAAAPLPGGPASLRVANAKGVSAPAAAAKAPPAATPSVAPPPLITTGL